MKDGIYHDVPITDYHAMARVGHTYLTRLDRCPAAARIPMEDIPAFKFGRAVHAWTLERKQDYCVLPSGIDRRTKEGKSLYAAIEQEAAGADILTHDEHMAVMAVRDAVMRHPIAGQLILNGVAEQSVFWTDKTSQLPCKARPDFINSDNVVIDLKTTTNADKHSFESWIRKSYALQNAFYIDGLRSCGMDCTEFVFIAVEKEEPYRVECYELDDEYIKWGRKEYNRLLKIELQCRKEKHYPHYQSSIIRTICKPEYL